MDKGRSLFIVRFVHTTTWAFFVTLILCILLAGITSTVSQAVFVRIALVALELIVLIIFPWRCPLTILAFRYTESRSSNFDIFLPAWLAEHKAIFAVLFAVAVALLAYRAF